MAERVAQDSDQFRHARKRVTVPSGDSLAVAVVGKRVQDFAEQCRDLCARLDTEEIEFKVLRGLRVQGSGVLTRKQANAVTHVGVEGSSEMVQEQHREL